MTNYGFVKCAISNFNSGLSNPKDSAEKIKNLVSRAYGQGVKVLIFPELCITGYTCQDLFGYSQLLESVMTCLKDLEFFSYHYDLLFVVGAPINVSDTLYNCAVVIQSGKIRGIVPKQYLPNANEFYEKRWFAPYTPDTSITSVNLLGEDIPFGNIIFKSTLGYKLGIEICEDLWSVIPPSSYLALAGADIIANLSASNELVGKDTYRKELIRNQSSRTISAYLYTSAGFSESTSDLVFGGSGYAFENGKELASLKRYQLDDQMEIFDVDIENLRNERINNNTFHDSKRNLNISYQEVVIQQYIPDKIHPLARTVNAHPFVPSLDNDKRNKVCREIISIQSTGLAKRLSTIGCKKVTIGISGGLDSTLALLVCYDAFKKLNLDISGIMGITMPGFGTTGRTYNNAVKLCKELGITLQEIPIKEACLQHFKDIGHDVSIHDITYENVQARERTQILMDLANKNNGILVGTGDLSELVLGWCTYNGDHMSMYGVNCSIPKTLVKYLIEWYANEVGTEFPELKETLLDIIDTPISPELLPTDGEKLVQKTESTVGPYEVIDFFIYNLLRKKFSGDKILYLANIAFEEKYSEHEISKYYDDFIKRFFRNQFKRNCLPDGPKVGTVSVSPRGDLRMPSDAEATIWKFKEE